MTQPNQTQSIQSIQINGRPAIGLGLKPYVIAEIGTNHNRDIDTARRMLDALAETGCHCAKFQIYEPEEIVCASVRASDYGLDEIYGDVSARDMFENHLKTPKEWFPELCELCHSLGMDFGATIHGPHGLAWAQATGLDMVKIASMDHTNLPFLESLVNQIDAPVLISFGMANEADVESAVAALSGHQPGVALFHCCAIYPPKPEEVRLSNIAWLQRRFGLPVGFSDHTTDNQAAVDARSMGAMMFEKHVTLDRTQSGPDHPFAMEMAPFAEYVAELYGTEVGQVEVPETFLPASAREIRNRQAYVKSVIPRASFPAGHVLSDGDVYLARPGTGIPPAALNSIMGKALARDVTAERPLTWADLGE